MPVRPKDPQREAKRRARYLDGTTELNYRKALALAYSEQGCSFSGIAQEIGSTKSTVKSYIDEIAERYGSDTVVRVDVETTADLVPVEEQPTEGPLKRAEAGRQVVIPGECPGPHTVERYFRTWMQEGRVHRDGKIALALRTRDEQAQNRLSDLEWDEHHCTYDPDYEFESATEQGAWTFDNNPETIRSVREVAHVPPVETIPVVAETIPRRDDLDLAACSNPECDQKRTHSGRDLDAYPRLDGPGVEITQESEVVSSMCLACRALFEPVPVGPLDEPTEDSEDSESESGGILMEAMQ
jgi:hypothetical protein